MRVGERFQHGLGTGFRRAWWLLRKGKNQPGICIYYWPSARLIWLDIGRVIFLRFLWTETKSRSIKTQKENDANTQPS